MASCFWLVPVLSHLLIRILIGVTPSWKKKKKVCMCPDMVTGDYVMSLTGVHTVNFILESAQPAEIEPAYLSIASSVV